MVALDEGQLFAVGHRLASGELLYRDIYTGLFPGAYYISAALLKLFGSDLIVTRWAAVAMNCAVVVLLWRISLRVASSFWSFLAPLVFLLLLVLSFPVLTMFSYSVLSLTFALGALLAVLRYLSNGRVGDAVLAGLCIAACGLCKQNYVVFVATGLALGSAWAFSGSALRGRGWVRAGTPVLAAATGASLLALLAIVVAGAGWEFFDATVLSLFATQMTAFNQPVPPIFGEHPLVDGEFVFFYTPSLMFNYLVRGESPFGLAMTPALRSAAIRSAYGLAMAILVLAPAVLVLERVFGKRGRGGGNRGVLDAASLGSTGPGAADSDVAGPVVMFSTLCYFGMFPSAIWSHLVVVLIAMTPALAILCDRLDGVVAKRSPRVSQTLRTVFVIALVVQLLGTVRAQADIRRWNSEATGIPNVSVKVSAGEAAKLRGAVDCLTACSRPDEFVLVAPDMPVLYAASGRRNPTPYDLIIPGNVKDDVIVERLESSGAPCLVYNPTMYAQFDDFEELFPKFTQYAASRFERTAKYGEGEHAWYCLERLPEDSP